MKALWFIICAAMILSALKKHAQVPVKHTSLILYQFKETAVVFDNEFAVDSSINYAPYYIQFPYGGEFFSQWPAY